ncbi:hypothetical protein PIB30_016219 [Stylosanthes scabra]|uniref:Uncharacterized protein n=1 Tax=Stylosanthes scabra TaxID=79078 RepID=A0ABU6W8F0_9FABA|nr:hypothetical protein [Stylosanthes scabra]
MGFFGTILGFFRFGVGINIGLIAGYFLFIYFQPTDVKIDWLNKFLECMWPYLDKAICKTAKNIAKSIIAEQFPKYKIDSVEFETLTLGCLLPTFQGNLFPLSFVCLYCILSHRIPFGSAIFENRRQYLGVGSRYSLVPQSGAI